MKWVVIRVNRDNGDTHAARTYEEAFEVAMPDRGSLLEWGEVEADDPGYARLMQPRCWYIGPHIEALDPDEGHLAPIPVTED